MPIKMAYDRRVALRSLRSNLRLMRARFAVAKEILANKGASATKATPLRKRR
jgi:hypothetical protein